MQPASSSQAVSRKQCPTKRRAGVNEKKRCLPGGINQGRRHSSSFFSSLESCGTFLHFFLFFCLAALRAAGRRAGAWKPAGGVSRAPAREILPYGAGSDLISLLRSSSPPKRATDSHLRSYTKATKSRQKKKRNNIRSFEVSLLNKFLRQL